MQTIMITGCSSGFGLETARYFLEQGWKVIATMRAPQEGVLPASDRLRLVRLDVTSAQSIAEAIAEVGEIDVLVNNAGVGMLNALGGGPARGDSQPVCHQYPGNDCHDPGGDPPVQRAPKRDHR